MQATSMGSNSTYVASMSPQISPERGENDKSETNCSPSNDDSAASLTSGTTRFKRNIKKTCFYCGGLLHSRNLCPAGDQTCHKCGKQGHFLKVCRSSLSKPTAYSSMVFEPNGDGYLVSVVSAGAPDCLQRTVVDAFINDRPVKALLDTGASENFIDKAMAEKLQLKYDKHLTNVTMATTKLSLTTQGRVQTKLLVYDKIYADVCLDVMQNACADIILGQRFLKKHKTVVFTFGGKQETLTVENADEGRYASLASIAIEPPLLFEHLKPKCKAIATHSRSYSQDDQR